MYISVTAVDPALRNFGIARLVLDLKTMALTIQDNGLRLVQTENRAGKVVRKNSDDLRRAQEVLRAFHIACQASKICFAEVPTGAQSARAMFANGMSIGVLASCPIPLIQVQPTETKLAAVGTKTASKEEMIEWATEKYPDAPWLRSRGKITQANEHLADAIAIAHAGVKTNEFQQLLAMWRATNTIAA